MPKVICLVPKERFDTTGVELPIDWHFDFLESQTEDDIINACMGADFLMVSSGTSIITSRIIENIPTIRMIQVDGAGFDKVDVNAAKVNNIPVANNAGANALTVAEFTICSIIALQRRINFADSEIKKGRYKEVHKKFLTEGLKELGGSKLGLIGLGAISVHVAKIANLLGAQVSYFDVLRRSEEEEQELNVTFRSFEEIITNSDIVSIHVPLNEGTKNLIGQKEISMMSKNALIINTSRGGIIDEKALAEALEKGLIGGAAIDTFLPEPPGPDHPLINLSEIGKERLLLTPHIAGITQGAFRRMLQNSLENLDNASRGKKISNVVNGVGHPRRV